MLALANCKVLSNELGTNSRITLVVVQALNCWRKRVAHCESSHENLGFVLVAQHLVM